MMLAGSKRSPRRAPGFAVSMHPEGNSTVVALHGNADLAALPFLVDMLAGVITDREGAVIVDLAATGRIDRASARAVALAAQCLGDGGRPMTVRSPSKSAATLLANLGLSDLVEPSGGHEI